MCCWRLPLLLLLVLLSSVLPPSDLFLSSFHFDLFLPVPPLSLFTTRGSQVAGQPGSQPGAPCHDQALHHALGDCPALAALTLHGGAQAGGYASLRPGHSIWRWGGGMAARTCVSGHALECLQSKGLADTCQQVAKATKIHRQPLGAPGKIYLVSAT